MVGTTKGRYWSLLLAVVDVFVIITGTTRRPDQYARPIFASLFLCWGLVFIWSPGSLGRSRLCWFSAVGRFWEDLDPGFISLIGGCGWFWQYPSSRSSPLAEIK